MIGYAKNHQGYEIIIKNHHLIEQRMSIYHLPLILAQINKFNIEYNKSNNVVLIQSSKAMSLSPMPLR